MRQKIGWLAGIASFVLILAVPAPATIPEPAHRMLALTAWLVLWWITEAVPIAVTALLPLALLPLLGIVGATQAAAPYADPTIFLFMGGFCLALAMEKWNLHRRIALHVVRLFGDQPSNLVFGFMTATALISMWISNTATTMMMLPIAMALLQHLGDKSDQKMGTALMLGIAYAASIGGMATLIGTPPNLVFAGQVRKLFPEAPEIGFLQWMQFGVPLVAVLLPLTWLYLTRVVMKQARHRLAMSRDSIKAELMALGRMSVGEKLTLFVFLLACAGWVFRQDLALGNVTIPGWSRWFEQGDRIHDSTIAIAAAITLMMLPTRIKPLEFVLDWKTTSRIPWGILILFGGGFALAEGFVKSGLADWLGQLFSTMSFPALGMIIFVCLVTTFMTEVTSNTATATLLMPILAPIALAQEMHPYALMIPAALSASCAFMLPVATPPNAIVFSTGHVTVPQMARTGLALNFIAAAVIILLTQFLLPYVFGLDIRQPPDWR